MDSETKEAIPVSRSTHRGPVLPFLGLDVLWIQVTGTLCNIACQHCFISAGPKNDSHPMMTTEQVLQTLEEARLAGVKEYYFTGGEPFLHPDILLLIEHALRQGPVSILTNGLLIDDASATALARLAQSSEHSLDLRLSVDGTTEEENDTIRGKGTFKKILESARRVRRAGLDPVFTVTTVHARYRENRGRSQFLEHLESLGFARPRVKFLPPFHIGREAGRSGSYEESFRLAEADLPADAVHSLQCGSCRAVTAKGVYPCPILIEESGARMAGRLEDAMVPIRLNHPACATCHFEGFTCRT